MNTIALQSFRPTARLGVVLSLVLLLSAFRHTDVDTQTNPAYVDYTFDAVYVQLPTANDYFREYVAERLAKEFSKSNVRMYTTEDLFSPIRDWTDEERRAVLSERGVSATIVISQESASERASPGTIFFNTDLGTATHVQAKSDRAVFHVRLIDIEIRDLAWTAHVATGDHSLRFGIESQSGQTGGYRIVPVGGDVPSSTETFAGMEAGVAVNGQINNGRDADDWFKVYVTANVPYEASITTSIIDIESAFIDPRDTRGNAVRRDMDGWHATSGQNNHAKLRLLPDGQRQRSEYPALHRTQQCYCSTFTCRLA